MARGDTRLFFKRFLASPATIGAVAPSGKQLSRLMAQTVNAQDTVLEIGAGTGSLTREIRKRLAGAGQLTCVEQDTAFAPGFRMQFPDVRLENNDAEEILRHGPGWDVVISGIPFAVMEPEKRHRMFTLIRDHLNPGGRFIAFQYSLSSKQELQQIFRRVDLKFAPFNIPPAVVYVCRDPKE